MATGPLLAPELAHTLAQQSQDRGGGANMRVSPVIGSREGERGSTARSHRRWQLWQGRGYQGAQLVVPCQPVKKKDSLATMEEATDGEGRYGSAARGAPAVTGHDGIRWGQWRRHGALGLLLSELERTRCYGEVEPRRALARRSFGEVTVAENQPMRPHRCSDGSTEGMARWRGLQRNFAWLELGRGTTTAAHELSELVAAVVARSSASACTEGRRKRKWEMGQACDVVAIM
jgi:hypothetical protein